MRTVQLKKWGNSMAIRLPQSVLTQAGISSKSTEFDVKIKNNEIILKVKKEPETLSELFEGFNYKKYWADIEKENPGKSRELKWSKPVGRELF